MAMRDVEVVSGSGKSGNKEARKIRKHLLPAPQLVSRRQPSVLRDYTTTTTVSLLDRLKASNSSDLSRKRKIAVNPTATVTTKPQECVAKFSGENLVAST